MATRHQRRGRLDAAPSEFYGTGPPAPPHPGPDWFDALFSMAQAGFLGTCAQPAVGASFCCGGETTPLEVGDLVCVNGNLDGEVVKLDFSRGLFPLRVLTVDGQTRWYAEAKVKRLNLRPAQIWQLREELQQVNGSNGVIAGSPRMACPEDCDSQMLPDSVIASPWPDHARQLPSLTGAARASDARPKVYLITVDKTTGSRLGIDIDHTDGETLLVEAVLDRGLINDWNRANPHKTVMGGDRIKEINGVTGSVQKLVTEAKRNTVHRIVLVRSGQGEPEIDPELMTPSEEHQEQAGQPAASEAPSEPVPRAAPNATRQSDEEQAGQPAVSEAPSEPVPRAAPRAARQSDEELRSVCIAPPAAPVSSIAAASGAGAGVGADAGEAEDLMDLAPETVGEGKGPDTGQMDEVDFTEFSSAVPVGSDAGAAIMDNLGKTEAAADCDGGQAGGSNGAESGPPTLVATKEPEAPALALAPAPAQSLAASSAAALGPTAAFS